MPALHAIRMQFLTVGRGRRGERRLRIWAALAVVGLASVLVGCGAKRPVLAPVNSKLRTTTTVAPVISPTTGSGVSATAKGAKLHATHGSKATASSGSTAAKGSTGTKGSTGAKGSAGTKGSAGSKGSTAGTVQASLPPMPNAMRGLIATPIGNPVVYKGPTLDSAVIPIPRVSSLGVMTVFAIVGDDSAPWIQVLLPTRPNGSTGWVQRSQVKVATTDARVYVNLGRRLLTVTRGRYTLLRATVAVGTVTNPTPTGVTYISELIDTGNPNGAYGPYAFGLALHSNTLTEFAGGDGQVAVHGTNAPKLIGQRVSHGCVRMANENVRRLVDLKLALGTPVYIH